MERKRTAAEIFAHAHRMIEGYHAALLPLCRETDLPPMALDILLFFANNPDFPTAGDICRMRGMKPGIVSFHVDRLVQDGWLTREEMPSDRRKFRLICADRADPIVKKGRTVQRAFGERLLNGLSSEQIDAFQTCLKTIDGNLDEIRKNGL